MMNPYQRAYMDPGYGGGTQSFGQQWGEGQDLPGGWDALKALQGEPIPQGFWSGEMPWNEALDYTQRLATEGGMGATGPLGFGGRIEKITGQGARPLITLQSWRSPSKGTPERLAGEATFTPAMKEFAEPPAWNMGWADNPMAVGELRGALEKELGPELNNLQLNSMLPGAIPFWESVARSRWMQKYPDLAQRIREFAAAGRTDPYGTPIPKSTRGSKWGKEWAGEHAEPTAEDLADWNYTGVVRSNVPGEPGFTGITSAGKPPEVLAGRHIWSSYLNDETRGRLLDLLERNAPDVPERFGTSELANRINEQILSRPGRAYSHSEASVGLADYLEYLQDFFRRFNEDRIVNQWSLD